MTAVTAETAARRGSNTGVAEEPATRFAKDQLKAIVDRIPDLAPVTFIVPLQGTLAVYLIACARAEGCLPEVLIAEAVRAYVGDWK